MLIPSLYSQKGIFEKVIRSRDGQLVRVFFEVYEIGGELRGRILRAEPILALARATTNAQSIPFYRLAGKAHSACTLLLCAPAKLVSPYSWKTEKKITSPFSQLDFLTSIKIRAPSYN